MVVSVSIRRNKPVLGLGKRLVPPLELQCRRSLLKHAMSKMGLHHHDERDHIAAKNPGTGRLHENISVSQFVSIFYYHCIN